jgi:hypothetical protein
MVEAPEGIMDARMTIFVDERFMTVAEVAQTLRATSWSVRSQRARRDRCGGVAMTERPTRMTNKERDYYLRYLADEQKNAKLRVEELEKAEKQQLGELIAAEFTPTDLQCEAVVEKLRRGIAALLGPAREELRGILDAASMPERLRPSLGAGVSWQPRGESATAERRTELFREGNAGIAANKAARLRAVDDYFLARRRAVLTGALQSYEGHRLLEHPPTWEEIALPIAIPLLRTAADLAAERMAGSEAERRRLFGGYGYERLQITHPAEEAGT